MKEQPAVTTIDETVQTTLRSAGYGSYSQYATPVVTALVDREQQIVGRLIEFAQSTDLDVDRVRTALADAGMHMPPTRLMNVAAPATEATPRMDGDPAQSEATEQDLTAVLGRIEEALSGLTGFAREHGYRG
jgi:hypothetical protein